MSTRRGTQHRRRRARLSHYVAPSPGEEILAAVQMACAATPADVPTARQVSHDMLIRGLGDRRRGPVGWYEMTAAQGRVFVQQARPVSLYDGGTVASDEHDRAVLEYLAAHPAGMLVVAFCDAVRQP
jgi:hypothetical protein